MDNTCGIYRIDCNGKCLYVGQSINLRDRRGSHLRRLNKNNHFNIYLQRMYNKYKNDFVFSKVENCPKSKLTEREMYWIKKLKPLCNMQIPSDSTHFTITDESRQKMSEISKKRMTPEMRKRISENTKKAMSCPDVRQRFLEGQRNKPYKEPWSKGTKGVLKAPNRKKVYCYELDKIFESAYACGIYLGAKDGKCVSRVCLGQRKTYKGMHFKYIE